SIDRNAFGPLPAGPNCRISNWRWSVSGYSTDGLKVSPNRRAAQFAEAGVSGFGKRQALQQGEKQQQLHVQSAVQVAEPEWVGRRAALHSKLLALAAIT